MLAFKSNINLQQLIILGNNMACPTQTVVGKDTPNPLIAEGLLKILRDLVPSSPLESHTNSLPQNGRGTKIPEFISPTK